MPENFQPSGQFIEAAVRFYLPADGGRQTPASGAPGRYRPRIIAEGRDLRHGVIFTAGPKSLELGASLTVRMHLMWYPRDQYEELLPSVSFTLWEGPHLVGEGKVMRRWGSRTSEV